MSDDGFERARKAAKRDFNPRQKEETEAQKNRRMSQPREDDSPRIADLKEEARAIEKSRRPQLRLPHPSPAGDVRHAADEGALMAQEKRYQAILRKLEAEERQRSRQEDRDL